MEEKNFRLKSTAKQKKVVYREKGASRALLFIYRKKVRHRETGGAASRTLTPDVMLEEE